MADHNHKNGNHAHHTPDASEVDIPVENMDLASRSLSEALGLSFIILKIIMVVVFVAFLGSGFKTIGPDEQAIVLRFGKLTEINNEQGGDPYVRGAGLIWTFPYPIDEVIRIPVKEKIDIDSRAFWYEQTPDEIKGMSNRVSPPGPTLDPLKDGYTLVRGQGLNQFLGEGIDIESFETRGTDYNFAHSLWSVTYEISDISRFFRNVLVSDPKPGENPFDVIKEDLQPLVKNILEDAVVNVMVRYSIDEVIESTGSIPLAVKTEAQMHLDRIESGLRLVSVVVEKALPPRQVQEAFDRLHTAEQLRETKIKEAETYRKTTLNEAAGAVAEPLAEALMKPNTPASEMNALWAQSKGEVRAILTEAETYRSQVVDEAKADASYFKSLLVQYRERPELLVENLHIDMLREILGNADEKFVQPPNSGSEREVRVLINSNVSLKKRKQNQQQPEPTQ